MPFENHYIHIEWRYSAARIIYARMQQNKVSLEICHHWGKKCVLLERCMYHLDVERGPPLHKVPLMKSERFGKVHILMYNMKLISPVQYTFRLIQKRPEPELCTYKRMIYRVRVVEVEYTLWPIIIIGCIHLRELRSHNDHTRLYLHPYWGEIERHYDNTHTVCVYLLFRGYVVLYGI